MAMGDYLQNMFLGTAYGGGEGGGKASQELWKIYQQAYNVRPVWNGKSWVIPPGAIQRFQMLLPLINAQMQGERAGRQQGADKGILAPIISKGISGLGNKALDKMGGWGGIYDKISGGVKGLWDSIGGSPTPDSMSGGIDNSGEDWWSGQPDNTIMPTVDPNVSEDWWSNGPDTTDMNWLDSIPIDDTSYYDYTENFW